MATRHLNSLRSEDGFTLVELLVAMVIGTVVLLASFAMLDTTIRVGTRVNTRVDTVQRGRTAMDLMIRDLRSQVCVGILTNASTGATDTDESLVDGSDTSVEFYTALGDGSKLADGRDKYPPSRRKLVFANNSIVEYIYAGSGQPGAYTFSTTATVRTLVTNVTQDGTAPVFRFYGYDTSVNPPTPTTLLQTPLATADTASKTVRIAIAFRVLRPGGTTASSGSSTLRDDVFRRAVDPNASNPSPVCAT